jgi:SpoVK/Ycf46/Vps4 family AAA+-type ATPase
MLGVRSDFLDVQDEVDAIATNRDFDHASAGSSVGVLTTLLTEMDGIEELNGVTVLAATNRPHVIVCILSRAHRTGELIATWGVGSCFDAPRATRSDSLR